jgi:hypothetical protein
MRIGQRADLEIDMYASRKVYRGRISGFTMGTGQTLALLPPQNGPFHALDTEGGTRQVVKLPASWHGGFDDLRRVPGPHL